MSASHSFPSSAVESASGTHRAALAAADGEALLSTIRQEAATLGFGSIGVADVDLRSAEPGLLAWLAQGFHGDMHYMAAHGLKRARPAELVPGTVRVITARMDYLPAATPADCPKCEVGRANAKAAGHRDWREGVCFDCAGCSLDEIWARLGYVPDEAAVARELEKMIGAAAA